MPLSMLQPIRTDDIAGIDSLKPYKVFLLRGLGEDDLVVKSEAKDRNDRRPLSNSIMKAVDPKARVKSLDLPELQPIKAFADYYMDYVENLHLIPVSETSVTELKKLFSFPDSMNPAYWTKMEKLELRNLDSTLRIPNDDDRDCALEQFARPCRVTGAGETRRNRRRRCFHRKHRPLRSLRQCRALPGASHGPSVQVQYHAQ